MLYSIITICFNDLENLKRTYETIYSQDFKDFEWVVVDGNSGDGTGDWLAALSDPFVQWKSEKDKGIFDGMNKGLSRAKGDYLIFMNSGDIFASSDVLSRVAGEMKNGDSFLYGDSLDLAPDGSELYRKSKSHHLLYRGMFTQHQAMFYRREKLNGQQYRVEYPITADYAFTAEFLNKCKEDEIHYLGFPVCKFLLGGTNESARFRALREDFRIRRKFIGTGFTKAFVLYILHWVHTLLKRFTPGLMKKIRYE